VGFGVLSSLAELFEHVESAPTDALRESMSRPNACRQAAKGTTMTTDHRVVGGLRLPQLIPRLLLRGNVSHHPAVLEEAERRNREFQLHRLVPPCLQASTALIALAPLQPH
jgi:hypothetical protein